VKGLRWIQGYYLASPLFFLFGLWWGIEIRVSFIPDPGRRFLYYLVLSGLGLLAHFRPAAAPWVAVGKSSVNLLLIMLWILVPIYGLANGALESGPIGLPYTPGEVLVNGDSSGQYGSMSITCP